MVSLAPHRCYVQKLPSLSFTRRCLDGEIGAMRDNIEGELPKGMPDRPAMIKDYHGRYHQEELDRIRHQMLWQMLAAWRIAEPSRGGLLCQRSSCCTTTEVSSYSKASATCLPVVYRRKHPGYHIINRLFRRDL